MPDDLATKQEFARTTQNGEKNEKGPEDEKSKEKRKIGACKPVRGRLD
jgi:hypothetical protein